MAIAFDNYADGQYQSGGTATWPFTCTGSNQVLLVEIWGDTSDTTTGVTYNGVAMTLIAKVAPSGSMPEWTYLFILAGPAAGTHNVVVTSTNQTVTGIKSLTGCNQTGQPDNFATTAGAYTLNTDLALTVVSSVANCWIIACVGTSGASGFMSNNANTDLRGVGQFGIIADCDSNAARAAGSNSLHLLSNNNLNYSAIVASIAPLAVVASFAPQSLPLMGVQ